MPPMGPGWPPSQGGQGYPPPGYPPPGYPPPGYPPPGYPPPGYQYGYPGYPAQPMALQPGVIPLRPLTLSDIFNAAIRYIRANPRATLGLTTAVVVLTQLLALLLQIGPLAATGNLEALNMESDSTGALLLSGGTSFLGYAVSAVAGIILSGMLTVVVGRAVFGTPIDIGEAWQRIRGRLAPLLGLVALEVAGAMVIIGAVIATIAGITMAGNGYAAAAVGVPLGLAALALLMWLYTMLSFAPIAVVLERKPVFAAISRSFALVRNSFWRILGIRMLAGVVAGAVGAAVAIPFGILATVAGSSTATVGLIVGTVLGSLGATIGQIITTPFSSGVDVLLYTDRRIRAEAFDLVLRTGAAGGVAPGHSTDHLWLTGP